MYKANHRRLEDVERSAQMWHEEVIRARDHRMEGKQIDIGLQGRDILLRVDSSYHNFCTHCNYDQLQRYCKPRRDERYPNPL